MLFSIILYINKTFKNHKVEKMTGISLNWAVDTWISLIFLEESTNFLFFAASFELETTFTGNTEFVGLQSLNKDFWPLPCEAKAFCDNSFLFGFLILFWIL